MKIRLSLIIAVLMLPAAFIRSAAAQDLPIFADGHLLADADIFIWQDTIAFFDGNYEDPTVPEGQEAFQVSTISWAGWGVFDQVGTYDFSAMAAFNLDFWVKADIDLTVEMRDATNGANGFPISDYGWDGTNTWQRITIPVTDFGRDLTQLESPFMITAPDAAVFLIDGVRWQDPVAANVNPVFDSNAVQYALVNRPFKYDVNADDGNFDRIVYSLTAAPTGMTIDMFSGLIQWVPTAADQGNHPVTVAINDGQGGVGNQSFILFTVVTLSPPQYEILTETGGVSLAFYNEWGTGTTTFGTGFITRVSEDFAGWGFFLSPVNVLDAAPMALHFNVDTTADLIIGIEDTTENNTVRISDYGWNGLPGEQQIIIPIVDFDADLSQLFGNFNATMEVIGTFTISDVVWRVPDVPNSPPTITSTPVVMVEPISTYLYDVDAVDPDSDPLTYSLLVAPANMGIDPNSGLILWLTEAGDIGSHPVTVQVSDGKGNAGQQSFTVEVGSASSLYGDTNMDGAVSALDASQAARHSVGLLTLTGQALINAEVSGDGNITAIDASQIARFSVGLIACFPADPSCP